LVKTAEQGCVSAKLVTNEHCSETVHRYNMHTIQIKPETQKHQPT